MICCTGVRREGLFAIAFLPKLENFFKSVKTFSFNVRSLLSTPPPSRFAVANSVKIMESEDIFFFGNSCKSCGYFTGMGTPLRNTRRHWSCRVPHEGSLSFMVKTFFRNQVQNHKKIHDSSFLAGGGGGRTF